MSRAPTPIPADSRLPAISRARLIAEIIGMYRHTRRGLRAGTLEKTLSDLRRDRGATAGGSADPRALGLRLGRAVIRTLEPLPTDSRCLNRSLVLTGLLARRGIETTLVLAVRAGDDFAAHAWVELDGEPLLEPAVKPFERLIEL